MKAIAIIFLAILFSVQASSQRFDLDLFAGITNYQGDLQPKLLTFQKSNPAAAIMLKYSLNNHFLLRSGFAFGSLAATDANNRDDLVFRNLSFRTAIKEFTLGIEYRFFDLEKVKVTPYVFVGAGVFVFNPFTTSRDGLGNRVYLQPLGTEGQDLPDYPDRTTYRLQQFCIPYGFGLKWQVNCNLNLGFELRQTKLFTDYLDDVSRTYADKDLLLASRGQQSVDYAWRGDQINGDPYPLAGTVRGNPGEKDWYYLVGITVGLSINDCSSGNFSLGGLFGRSGGGKGRFRTDCPKVW